MRPSKFLILFGLFWSALVLVFDGTTLFDLNRQIRSVRYPAVDGTILASEVVTFEDHSEDGGDTYGVKLSFSYSVNGRVYIGERYRYNAGSTSDPRWARGIVANHSPGTRVRVFYNPKSPEDSLLAPGLSGGDLFMVLFLTPFNVVMLGFCWAGWNTLWRRSFNPLAGGVRIIPGLRETRVRLSRFSPLAAGVVALGLAAFIASLLICFTAGGFHPSLTTMRVAWSLILAIGVGMGVWCQVINRSGKYDLIIDEPGGALELPPTNGRKTRSRIPFDHITRVYVETLEKRDGDGNVQFAYAPALGIVRGEGIRQLLVEWHQLDKAQSFVEWLKTKLPLPPAVPVAEAAETGSTPQG